MVAQPANGSVARLGCSSALRVNLRVGVRTEFLTEVFTLRNKRCTKQAGWGDTWKAAGFFPPTPGWIYLVPTPPGTCNGRRWSPLALRKATRYSVGASRCHVTYSLQCCVDHTVCIQTEQKKQHHMTFLSWLGEKEEEIKNVLISDDRQKNPTSTIFRFHYSQTSNSKFRRSPFLPLHPHRGSQGIAASESLPGSRILDICRQCPVLQQTIQRWLNVGISTCMTRYLLMINVKGDFSFTVWGVFTGLRGVDCLLKPLCVMLKLCAPR